MGRQCTQPKMTRNAAWFKEKEILAEAQKAGPILNEEQLAFLVDAGIPDGQTAQTTILNTAAFQSEDLDAYDSDCDDVSNAKAVLMANLSNYGYDVILKRIKPALYDGSVISKQYVASPVFDDEETLILGELQTSDHNTDQFTSSPIKIEAPWELPKITPDALTEGKWGFEHTKAVFLKEIISFLNTLKDIFNIFDKDLLNEKKLFLENDRLLQKITSQDVMICVMNSIAAFDDVNVEMQSSESCVKCMDLDAELLNKQNAYNDLSKKYFENNDLKAQLQAKDTTICKLKDHIKSMRENDKEEKVKYEMDKIETINIKLEHSVTKLLYENERLHKEIEHLKKIYKDQFDSIKKTSALSKAHGQEVKNAAQIPIITTVAPGMFKLDLDPLAPRLLQNKEAHIYYLKYTQEQADILQGIVKQAKAKKPLDNALDLTCKHATRIQESLVYV
nr:hypothetical protein [Tanacetum cinerariifolium]